MLADRKPQDIDVAIRYLSARDGDQVKISKQMGEFIERMVRFQALVLRHTKARAIEIYRQVFDLSKSQAYRDHQKMEIIFGNAKKTNRDFMRELSILKLEKLEQKAEQAGDLKTAAQIRMKIFDWSTKETIQPPFNPNDVEPPVIIVGDFPDKFKNSQLPSDPAERERLILELKAKHSIDDIENIDFTEIDDEGIAPGTSE
jgi:hypothetical protein